MSKETKAKEEVTVVTETPSDVAAIVTKAAKKKPAEKAEVKELPTNTVVSDDSFGGFMAARKRKYDGVKSPLENVTDKPVVTIAGKEITLEEISRAEISFPKYDNYHREENILFTTTDGYRLRASRQSRGAAWGAETLLPEADAKFYKAVVDGIIIYISSGAELHISDSIRRSGYWLDMEDPADTPPTIINIGSVLNFHTLNVGGKNYFNNSQVTSKGYAELTGCSIKASSIHTSERMNIDEQTSLTSTVIRDIKSCVISKTRLHYSEFSGLRDLRLFSVTTYEGFVFQHHFHSGEVDFFANDTRLADWEGRFPGLGSVTGYDAGRPHYTPTITVNRRVDYGFFAGVKPVPFIRLGEHDLIVGSEIFTAKELFPELVVKKPEPEVENNSALSYPRWGGYTPTPFSSPVFGFARNSDLWHKACKIVFPGEQQVISKSGDAIIVSLLEQIKSRIGLLVEVATLKD